MAALGGDYFGAIRVSDGILEIELMYPLLRPLLFRLDPERAHILTIALLKSTGELPLTNYLLRKIFEVRDPRLEVEAFGIRFNNPIGLAAGYDKNGIAVKGLSCLGFGHIEIGTVTRHPQAGNPRPRIHRVSESRALINNMGFPNAGVDALTPNPPPPSPSPVVVTGEGEGGQRGMGVRLGINIGKSKDTPLERAAEDYCELFKRVYKRADYVALNVSSPNTPELRKLQSRTAIKDLLRAVAAVRDDVMPRAPLLVKISPDMNEAEIDDVLASVIEFRVDGVIATNTTVSRKGLSKYANVNGGLSGEPLRARATEVIRYLARHTDGKLPIVGAGGISSASDALEKLRAGARLIQVYTGLVYEGPGLIRQINLGLLKALEREGLKSVAEFSQVAR